jgi:hypothetical protein
MDKSDFQVGEKVKYAHPDKHANSFMFQFKNVVGEVVPDILDVSSDEHVEVKFPGYEHPVPCWPYELEKEN